MNKDLTCISCPQGCKLLVRLGADGTIASVAGNKCARGIAYAEEEILSPRRTLTTTVRIDGAAVAMLPVKTAAPIPKDMVEAASVSLADVIVAAPVVAGDVIIRDILGSGIDLIATRSLPEAAAPYDAAQVPDSAAHAGSRHTAVQTA